MDIQRGSIIWANVPDPNGHRKDRPLVVLSFADDPREPLNCCAITTVDKRPRPQTYARIPWDAAGKSQTRLKEPCFAVADWIVPVPREDVRKAEGCLSSAHFAKLLDLVAAVRASGK